MDLRKLSSHRLFQLLDVLFRSYKIVSSRIFRNIKFKGSARMSRKYSFFVQHSLVDEVLEKLKSLCYI